MYTYQMLHDEVCRFAAVLRSLGVKKGDRVSLYMPMIPELAFAMLACTRIGAVHSVVFAGFRPSVCRTAFRIARRKCWLRPMPCCVPDVRIPLKNNVDEALRQCPSVEKCIVVRRAGVDIPMEAGRDLWWDELAADPELDAVCPCEEMESEDPLFILYTSGFHGTAQGGCAHHRRVSDLCRPHHAVGVRPAG